jgi:hypothetical protein
MGSLEEGTLVKYDWHPYKKEKFGFGNRCTQREDSVQTHKGRPR